MGDKTYYSNTGNQEFFPNRTKTACPWSLLSGRSDYSYVRPSFATPKCRVEMFEVQSQSVLKNLNCHFATFITFMMQVIHCGDSNQGVTCAIHYN